MLKELVIDSTVNIEGVATAIGVLGAAFGYIISLLASWRRNYKQDRSRGTKLLILHILESELPASLTEAEIIKRYSSQELSKLRESWGTWDPKKLNDLMFEREITALRAEHLIDLTGTSEFRLRHDPIRNYDLRDQLELQTKQFISEAVDNEELVAAAKRIFYSDASDFERREAAEFILMLGSKEFRSELIRDLKSDDVQKARIALSALRQPIVRV